MEKEIKDLTLLLLYLTHWEEKSPAEFGKIRRSWKGYPFEALDALEEDGLLSQTRRAKSVYLTEVGVKKAEELKRKYKA